jgi:hypothetical protein
MPLNDKTASFSLLRANPKISGNVKLTVDSTGLIWLNSFDATKELSSSQYKKFQIGTGSSFESDLKKFIGALPPSIVFFTKERNPDPTNVSNTFKDQYDFFYNMGAENLVSKFYDEEYSYLAPLWIRDELPEYFVIMRIDEPLDFPYNENVASGDLIFGKTYIVKGDQYSVKNGPNVYVDGDTFVASLIYGADYTVETGTGKVIELNENKALPIDNVAQFESLVKRAQIIKTFDLTESSNIGKYIRNIVNNKFFPEAPLSVRFGKDLMTTWNGVSYQDGIVTSKGERLEDFWTKGQKQIDFEEYITQGFERHGVICPYLLNLEFLFNDADTPTYSIPRYMGFYVSKVDIAKFQLDGNALYDNRFTSGNTPAPKRPNRGFRHQGESFFQTNENGVRMFYMNEMQVDPSVPLFIPSTETFTTNFMSRFYWIQDKNGNFYSLDQTGDNVYNTDPAKKDIVVRNHEIDLGNFGGPGKVKLQTHGNRLSSNGRSYMVLRINTELFPGDSLSLYWNLGVFSDANGKYHKIVANDLSKRPFTVPANGTVLTIAGMDITSQYQIGQTIQINYGTGNSVLKTLVSAPVYAFGDTTLVIDSPIDATTTSASTPIVLGWGPGSALTEDNNQTIYFHPYGTYNQIAQSISKALNLIEDKTFDAVVIDDQVVIRMRNGESITDSFFMVGQLALSNEIYFHEVGLINGQKYYFEGGTDTPHIRLRFPFDSTDILADGEVYVKSKRGISKVKFVGRYVDETTEVTGGIEIGDLPGFREYGALYIEDNLDEPVVTTSGDFIAYTLFDISVGLFSVFNVKDIDGDFFSSTYSRTPTTEVHRYFDIFADTPKVLVPGRKYLVKSDDPTHYITHLGVDYFGSSNGTVFTAGMPPAETVGLGDAVHTNFTFVLQYYPVAHGTVSITDGSEIFTDNNGILTGTVGGSGVINYETGEVDLTFFVAPINLATITASYESLAGFTVGLGNPIVVALLFHAAMVQSGAPLDPSHQYTIIGDPTESIQTFTSPHVANSLKFASFTGTTFIPSVSENFFEIATGNPLVIDITKYQIDSDLNTFPGFWTFKDLSDASDTTDTTTILFSNREKFIHHDLDLEYDFLKENFSKEESVKSRVVQTVSKWVYKGGDDVRDNPYRLNTHPLFGAMNFSPSFHVRTQDPSAFTHEWPYLEQAPHQYPEGLLKDNYYFFYDKIVVTETEADSIAPGTLYIQDANPANPDYFTDYFTFTPVVDTPEQERYNIFSFNKETGICEAFFRGIKIRIKEVIKDTQIQQIQGIKPPFKPQSTKYDGYKFSVILRPVKEDRSKIQAPVTFNIMENATHKTILFVIDLVIEDYRTFTILNPNNLGQSLSPEVNYEDLVSTSIDYVSLYSMKSKKIEKITEDSGTFIFKGLDGSDFGNIKLSVGLDLSPPSGINAGYTVVNAFDNPDYDWDLRDEVKNFKKENVFNGEFVFAGGTFLPYPLSANQKQILFGIPGNMYPQDINPYPSFEAPILSSIPIPYGSSFYWVDKPTMQLHAGELYLEPIMQRLSFANIADKINMYSQYVKYNTYTWDGSTTRVTPNNFYIELVEPSKITKIEAVLPQLDEDRPEELKNESIIGVVHTTVAYFDELYRYAGPYEPKFRDVLFFNNQKLDEITEAGVDLSFKQATFNPNIENFGFLKNLGILKVAKTDVLALTNNTKYKPRYPLIHETPLDTKDHFIFQSSWDPGFWRVYTTKSDFFPQAGTREMQEVKNFLGTKIMKTLATVRLQDWTIEPQLPSLDMVNVENFAGEIVYAVVGGKLQAQINVKKRLLRFLFDDGADTEFNKYLLSEFGIGDPELISDDVIEYLTLNVLPTYEVKIVDLYIRKYKENLGLDIIRGDMTDAQKLENQYILDKNFSAQKKSDFVYYFEYVLDDSFKVSLAPSLSVGKI